jgi:hypothetical protein
MVTPEGYLFSREALLENLLQQKKAIKKKQAAYEAQQAEEQQKVRPDAAALTAHLPHPHPALARPIVHIGSHTAHQTVPVCTCPSPCLMFHHAARSRH